MTQRVSQQDQWPTVKSYSRALETASRTMIEELQARKLKALVGRLFHTNEFYGRLLTQAGVRPEDIRSLDDIRRIPVVNKSMFVSDQQDRPPFGSRLGVPAEDIKMIHVTSGTSGQGQEVYGLTAEDVELVTDSSVAMWRWAGLDPSDVASSMVGVTNSAAGVSMRPAVMAAGRYLYHVGHLPYGERIEMFRKMGLNAIYGMPSYFAALSGLLKENGVEPKDEFPDMRCFILAGESYPIPWAERLAVEWGTNLHETYGSTQTGGTCTAGTCRHGALRDGGRGRIHLFEWTVLYEVINPATGEHVQSGEEGELYVTTLDRFASPTLRFASGDRVRWFDWTDGCDCGLAYSSLEAGTIGRLDDMLKIKGMNVWPSAVDEVILSHEMIEDYRAVIEVSDRGRTDVNVQLLLTGSDHDSEMAQLCSGLEAELKSKIGISFAVAVADRSELKPHEFKARRWIDRRHETLA